MEPFVSDTNTNHERRRFQRINFDARVRLFQDDQCWETQLLDISLRGILAERPRDFGNARADRPFRSEIELNQDDPGIQMSLTLVHQGEKQLGFRCDDIDLDSVTCLRRLIELNLGDPQLLERELTALVHQD